MFKTWSENELLITSLYQYLILELGSTKTYKRISTDDRSIVNTHSIEITAKFAVSIKRNKTTFLHYIGYRNFINDLSWLAVKVLTLCCFCGLIYEAICFTLFYFVLVFFSPFSIAITSLGEEWVKFSAFLTFIRFALVWFCPFPLPPVVVALPGLFSYLILCIN